MTGFRWIEYNQKQATKHGCTIEEIEETMRRELARGRFAVWRDDVYRIEARGRGGRVLEIGFIFDPPDASIIYDQTVFVIHAMPLSTRRRRRKF